MGEQDLKTILLVEDESIIALDMAGILGKYGYSVVTAENGASAVDAIQRTPLIDLVLMDIFLGRGMDGAEAARIILGKKNIPIVFISSHTDRGILEKIEGIASYGFVVKGSGENALIASLRMAFRLFDSNQQALQSEVRVLSEHLKALLAAIPDIVTEVNNERIITWTNPAGLQFFGDDVVGREASHYFEGEQDTYNVVRPLFEGRNDTIYLESWQKRRDGEKRLLAWWCRALKDNDDRVSGAISTARDITEQREMEIAVQKEYDLRTINEERLSMSLEVSNAGIWEWDLVSDGMSFDARFHRMLGYDAGDLPENGSDWLLYHHPDDRSVMMARVEACARGNNPFFEGEHRVRAKNGCWNWVFARGKLTSERSDSPSRKIMGIAMNITAFKEAEEALRESEKKYRQIIENMNSGVFITTLDGTFLHMNGMVAEMAGYDSIDEMMKMPAQHFYADQGARDRIIATLLDRGSFKDMEMQLIKKDGTRRWISMNAILLPDPDGRSERLMGVINDVTDRKMAEENIRSLLSEKELLLKEVHHRIKNNMNTMISLLELQAVGLGEPSAIEALHEVKRRMQSMSLLYDKLYRAKNLQELSTRAYLSPLIREIITMFPGGSAVKIEEDIGDFILDTKKLQTLGIMVNELLTNIMKYAFTGRDDGTISVRAIKESNHVAISIHDDGIGLHESLDIDSSTGFGFRLVKILAQQLEGTLSVERDGGTRINITFDA